MNKYKMNTVNSPARVEDFYAAVSWACEYWTDRKYFHERPV